MSEVARELLDITEARKYEHYILTAWQERREYMQDFYSRVSRFDSFLDGDWMVEFPDGRTIHDRPKIENRMLSKVEDTGYLSGQWMPSVRVEASNERDYENAKLREKVIQFYWQNSELGLIIPKLFMDMIALGFCAMKVWPDLTCGPEETFPIYKRIDPRFILPPMDAILDEEVNPHDVIVHKWTKARTLMMDYPDQMTRLNGYIAKMAKDRKGRQVTDSVVLLEYWGRDSIVRVAMVEGNPESSVVLDHYYNETGMCPVVLGVRPSATGKVRGKVEPMIPTLGAENRLMTYILDYIDQGVYSPLAYKGDVRNPRDFGPNSIIDLGTNGEMGRIPPAQIAPEVWRVRDQLELSSRRSGNHPEARAGNVDVSIGSAAFVESLLGGLTSEVQMYQKVMEVVLRHANVIAQKEDAAYCNARKSIEGLARGGHFRERYTPADLLKYTANYVSYGVGSGLDKFNAEVRMTQRQRSGYVSQRWVRENMDGIENVVQEEERILDEAALAALVQGILANAAQGNLAPLSEFMAAREKDPNPLAAIRAIAATATPPTPAGAGVTQPGVTRPGTNPADEAKALQKGGIPGQAGSLQGGPPSAALPPLATLLGG